MQTHSYYVFVSGDVFSEDEIIPAPIAIRERLKTRYWPLNEGTKFRRRLAQGDKVVLYAAGRKNNVFVATASLDSGSIDLSREEKLKTQWKYDYVLGAEYGVWLKEAEIFGEPVPIRPLLSKLSFIGPATKWGIYLRNPVIRITEDDFNLISVQAGLGTAHDN